MTGAGLGSTSSGAGRSGRRGLTLLEVVVASTLLVTAIGALLSGFRLGLNAARRARSQVVVDGLAEGLWAEIARDGFEKARSKRGTFAPDVPWVAYEVRVEPAKGPALKSVAIVLRFDDGALARALVIDGLLADRKARRPPGEAP